MPMCSLFYFVLVTLVVGVYGTRNDSIYNVQALRARLGSEGTKKFEIPTSLPNVTFEIPPHGVVISRLAQGMMKRVNFTFGCSLQLEKLVTTTLLSGLTAVLVAHLSRVFSLRRVLSNSTM